MTLFDVPAWQRKAACWDAPSDALFFLWDAHRERDRYDRIQDTIEKYCSKCPVKQECEDYGREMGSAGVWGGKHIGYRESSKNQCGDD